MSRTLLFSMITLFLVAFTVQGQVTIDSFDSSAVDAVYQENVEGAPSYIEWSDNHADYVEGTGAFDVKYVIGEFHNYGSYANMMYRINEGTEDPLDWTTSDSLSIWIKVRVAPTNPQYMVFRIHIMDRPSPGSNTEEYVYENQSILDEVTSGFVKLDIPLIELEQNGTTVPNEDGFILTPDDWNQPQNNKVLDRDKIIGYNLSAIVSGWDPNNNLPADSVEVSFDAFKRKVAFVFFNGQKVASDLTPNAWGQSTLEVVEDSGATPGTNALKWVQGDEWGGGWSGINFDISPSYDMSPIWDTDSIKLKMRVQAGTGDMRIQFIGGVGKLGKVFTPIDDNVWHYYAFKLSDLVYQDGTSNFDASDITKFELMAEESAIVGQVIYIDDVWTGTPNFDVVPPAAVENVTAAPNMANRYTIIGWSDLESETGESYYVYVSPEPIIDIAAAAVERLGIIEKGIKTLIHYPRHPLVDTEVTYYYAVQAQDGAGNFGPVSAVGPIVNTAQGIATFSLDLPANLVIDGDILEWESSSIMPWVLKRSNNTISFVSTGTVTDDADLEGTIYLAMDADNLYIAANILDDDYDFGTGDWWQQDVLEIFIGLYDQRSAKHSSLERGAEPDYKIVLKEDELVREPPTLHRLAEPGTEFFGFNDWGGGEYSYEAKIPFASLKLAEDATFTPERGMRIPIELTLHDRDNGVADGNLVSSPTNTDNAYYDPRVWSYTWIGDTTSVTAISDNQYTPDSYGLEQNYPNPFNPSTTIAYSIAKQSQVNISVFNLLGQRVKTLIDRRQAPGAYQIRFEGRDLTSGVYFYQITAGEFTQIKKMLLVK